MANRNEVVKVRFSKDEHELVKEMCPASQISPWLRELALESIRQGQPRKSILPSVSIESLDIDRHNILKDFVGQMARVEACCFLLRQLLMSADKSEKSRNEISFTLLAIEGLVERSVRTLNDY